MKLKIKLILTIPLVMLAGCSNDSASSSVAKITEEVGCGMCIYHMDGVSSCATAVKIGDTPYLLSDNKLDAHSSGICAAPKRAEVSGKIVEGKYVASTIRLVAE